MKPQLLKLFIMVFAFCSISNANAQITLHTIGDSTQSIYDENTSQIRGWGMMLPQFFTSGIKINDRAKAGASSKSFYLEAPYWTSVKTQIKTGDYVLIQFAHNDEKSNGLDGGIDPANPINGDDYRGTTAQGTYKEYLRKYVNETRALNAIPILATPMCRKYFKEGVITRAGRHDLGDTYNLPLDDHSQDYSFAMKEVATEMNVLFIDLTTLTKNLFEEYGDAACTAQLFVPGGDATHPAALGGTLVARLCAQDMLRQDILTPYINTATDVLVNPVSSDFGNAYTGQTLTKEFTITGLDLSPASGTFTLSATEGFLIAANKTDTFSSSITMNYTNSNLAFTKFYVSANQKIGGKNDGILTVTSGKITKTIPLTANFIELTGGTDVNLVWPLLTNDSYVLTGPALPLDQSFSGMKLQVYGEPKNGVTFWPTESEYFLPVSTDKPMPNRKTQRTLIDNPAGEWPANEIDEVSTRYIQFGISASEGTELNIDNISMYVGGAGGSGMKCRISYSTDDFSTVSVISELKNMASNTMTFESKIPVVKLAYGQTLKVRVYPWYGSAATGKSICLADVKIHGVALPASNLAVDQFSKSKLTLIVENSLIRINNAPENSKITIYDINGKQVIKSVVLQNTIQAPKTKGIYIAKIESQQGTETVKFFMP